MTNVLILGAGGQIARLVTGMLADRDDVRLALYLRDAAKLRGAVPGNSAAQRRAARWPRRRRLPVRRRFPARRLPSAGENGCSPWPRCCWSPA